MGKFLGVLVGIFMALAGPLAIGYAGYWWALDRPAYHIGWCPFCIGWNAGAGAQLAALQAAEKAAAAHTQVVELRGAQVTAQAAQHETQVQTQIITQYRTITREAQDALTPQIDNRYPLPNGLVRVYDGAALGVELPRLSNPGGQSDDAPSAVTDSAAGDTFVINGQLTAQCYARVADLQAWITAEQAAAK